MAGLENVINKMEVGAGVVVKKKMEREVAVVQKFGLVDKLVAAVQVRLECR